ncbi:hypothetical protein LTR91_016803 [Friedmanniomyces endolithicus]|uniref:Myb-like domain-containing protein n=1 Tax=Friedmanniomyces endolithicus TaxID=329885 RepID=A0AAN6K7R7_9PEZI|nr:hypothetical protein LTR57_013787 [Friedmanniomyces endolithicus]KAK0968267.1 hypothetical protein LTR91_016803 [Friedmanniomyces endolithicus]KAK1037295.1 hypothetical protein LTS16_012998 [Friedmanniomyces endolithicus]
MAPEVVNLVSDDSDEDVLENTANATLQSFGPRKQKNHVAAAGSVQVEGGAYSVLANVGAHSAQARHHGLLPALDAQRSPGLLERKDQRPGMTHTECGPTALNGRAPPDQLGNGPRKPLLKPIQLDSRPSQRLISSNRPHDPTPTELVARVDHYENFHAKEQLRLRKLANTTAAIASAQARPPPARETPSENPNNCERHNTDPSGKADRQWSNLSILDVPPGVIAAEDAHSRKRPAPAPLAATLGSTSKRARSTPYLNVTSQQAASNPSKARDAAHRRDDATHSADLQLEQELLSALAAAEMGQEPSRELPKVVTNVTQAPEATQDPPPPPAPPAPQPPRAPRHPQSPQAPEALQAMHHSGAGAPYTEEENALIARLKEDDGLTWVQIMAYFPQRSKGSLNVHYSTKIKGRYGTAAATRAAPLERQSKDSTSQQAPLRHKRGGGASAQDGFISWAQASVSALTDVELSVSSEQADAESPQESGPMCQQDCAFLSSRSQILRQRELGIAGGRGWSTSYKRIPNELKNILLQDYTPARHYMSTSGDVTCLVWAADDRRFAAGSIAITDDRSMQYNCNLNLLVGDIESAVLQELPEHHVQRPTVKDYDNVNALHSMRESQDPRLFTTVAAVGFSPDGRTLYSAGSDRKLRAYSVHDNVSETRCLYDIQHIAAVDLLSINQRGLVATACHTSADGSIKVFDCDKSSFKVAQSLSPSRTDSPSSLPIFPTALRWGVAPQQSSYLLAGFSSDSIDVERDTAGETALWHAERGLRVSLSTVTRNVFDVAWNPTPSPASTAFCVASTPGGYGKSSPERRSVVQCYAPEQNRARQVLEWECPAFDINDVMYCPYDDYLIAAGATDGNVYLWDKRFASRDQKPLHTFSHGDSINVLDHGRDRSLADTGVRFLSWGATSSRLYSGSSDGLVKVWNPYRSPDDAFVSDVATFQAAVMSGAFSSDFRQLLIGEERGRLNSLNIGRDTEDELTPPSTAFRLSAVTVETVAEPPFVAARDLVKSQQIEIRDMGALPVRQAVQGPAYQGPYLKPSTSDWSRAYEQCQQSRDRQVEVRSRPEECIHDSQSRDAEHSVERADEALSLLQTREDSHPELYFAALATQRAFCDAFKRRITLGEDRCKLDCNYLPPEMDQVVADSHRSELRIPGAIRAYPGRAIDLTTLDCDGLFEFGLAGKCKICSAKEERASTIQVASCRQRCSNIRAEFTGPVGNQVDNKNPSEPLCERCGFTCLRCSRPVQVMATGPLNDYSIYCGSCDLAWEVDVLGYNLVRNGTTKPPAKKRGGRTVTFGREDTELSYYHSRWRTTLDRK